MRKSRLALSFSEAMKSVNAEKTRRGPAQGSIHYPWLAAGALVDMMDRIFDVNGMRSRPAAPASAIKYSLKRQKKWSAV